MEKEVSFSLEVSELHTKEHCSRVLLFALLLGDKISVSDKEKKILCTAASFHDSRRHDDWLDKGHGRRAAEYYKSYCIENDIEFETWCYDIMAYHDLNDDFGIKSMEQELTGREVLLYKIFKDADALDRFRLGEGGLDVSYLRTDEARSLYSYAELVWKKYQEMKE